MMNELYKRVPVDEVTPVVCVGVYVTKWQPAWGEPTYAFVEAHEDVLEARIAKLEKENERLKDMLKVAEDTMNLVL